MVKTKKSSTLMSNSTIKTPVNLKSLVKKRNIKKKGSKKETKGETKEGVNKKSNIKKIAAIAGAGALLGGSLYYIHNKYKNNKNIQDNKISKNVDEVGPSDSKKTSMLHLFESEGLPKRSYTEIKKTFDDLYDKTKEQLLSKKGVNINEACYSINKYAKSLKIPTSTPDIIKKYRDDQILKLKNELERQNKTLNKPSTTLEFLNNMDYNTIVDILNKDFKSELGDNINDFFVKLKNISKNLSNIVEKTKYTSKELSSEPSNTPDISSKDTSKKTFPAPFYIPDFSSKDDTLKSPFSAPSYIPDFGSTSKKTFPKFDRKDTSKDKGKAKMTVDEPTGFTQHVVSNEPKVFDGVSINKLKGGYTVFSKQLATSFYEKDKPYEIEPVSWSEKYSSMNWTPQNTETGRGYFNMKLSKEQLARRDRLEKNL